MVASNAPELVTTLETLIAPGGRSRLSPYIESAQFQLLFAEVPDPRRRYDSAQRILDRHRDRVADLVLAWASFVESGKNFAANDYTDPAFLDAYLIYYLTPNIAKIQLSLLDLVRHDALGGGLRVLDVGVGTGTTLVALLDFLIAWSNACDLYGAPFPVTDVTFVGVDCSAGSLAYASRMGAAFADALAAGLALQEPPPERSILALAERWARAAEWQQHDLDAAPCRPGDTNLLVASNSLSELQSSGREHLGRMIAALVPQAVALVIEPGDQHSAKRLMGWRRRLLAASPRLASLGPCGACLGRSLPSSCDDCWSARRESLHQPPLYARFRKGAAERLADPRRFDDYENRLLSWSYVFLQSAAGAPAPTVIPISPGTQWPEDRQVTYIGRYTKTNHHEGPVGYGPDDFPAGRDSGWVEFIKFCPAEAGARQFFLARRPGAQVPALPFGARVQLRGVEVASYNPRLPAALQLESTTATGIVAVGAERALPATHFLPQYDERARRAVDQIAHRLFGFPAMHPFQHKVLARVLSGKHILAIAATGSGKSECFILPAMILPGLTVVISPLKSLIMDQYGERISRRYGLQSLTTFINGDVPFNERQARLKRMELGHYKLVYFTPEQFGRGYVLDSLKRADERVGVRYLAMDEAHCVSQWGHDFRSSYLNLVRRLAEWGIHPVRIALTATASPNVRADLCEELELNPAPLEQGGDVFIESSNRPELNLIVRVYRTTSEKVEQILDDLRALSGEYPDGKDGAAIVFMPYTGGNPDNRNYKRDTGTRRGRLSAGVTAFAAYLERELQETVAIYHGKMEDGIADAEEPDREEQEADSNQVPRPIGDLGGRTRRREQEAFISGERQIMVATKGFGMGIDKDNIRLVLHRTPPANLEAYAQEAGRAGRDGEQANVVLYYSPDPPRDDETTRKSIPSDYDIQRLFLTGKYVRRSDVVVMRAFLRTVRRQVGAYLYFTNDEALDFFDRCRETPALAGLAAPYAWPEFPEREPSGKESDEHRGVLDRGHRYQQKSDYIERILDVLYRLRPTVDGLGTRIAFVEWVQECGAAVRGLRVLDVEAILASNAYFGQLLRDRSLTPAGFAYLLRRPDLLPLAERLALSPSETGGLLADIKNSDGYFDRHNKWVPKLLDYTILLAPCYGPAQGQDVTLAAWRDYAGAYKRAYKDVAHARAREAGRPGRPSLDDWFYWPEVNSRLGWEILPGPAFHYDEHFSRYLEAFMALHDERERNDRAAYHRLLTDYVGVNEDGSLRTAGRGACLRAVLLGYLKTYEVINGQSCYSCSHCVPDENFTRYPVEERRHVVVPIGQRMETLLDHAETLAAQWPPHEFIQQLLDATHEGEAAGRSVRAYVEGWTGRLLQDTPGHLAALCIRSEGMVEGLFEEQPRELAQNLRAMVRQADKAKLETLQLLVSRACEALPESPDLCALRAELARRLGRPHDEQQAWRDLLALVAANKAPAVKWRHQAHVGLAILHAPDGPLAAPDLHTQHALLAARWSPDESGAEQWYRPVVAEWEWTAVAEELAVARDAERDVIAAPALLKSWLLADPANRQQRVAGYLAEVQTRVQNAVSDQGAESKTVLGELAAIAPARAVLYGALRAGFSPATWSDLEQWLLLFGEEIRADPPGAFSLLMAGLKFVATGSERDRQLGRLWPLAQMLFAHQAFAEQVHSLWMRLAQGSQSALQLYLAHCVQLADGARRLDTCLEALLSRRQAKMLAGIHGDVPSERWQRALQMARLLRRFLEETGYSRETGLRLEHLDMLSRLFQPNRDREQGDMLIAVIDHLRRSTSPHWLTPLARHVEVCASIGRFEEARAVASNYPQLRLGKRRLTVEAFINRCLAPTRRTPIHSDYPRIAEQLLG